MSNSYGPPQNPDQFSGGYPQAPQQPQPYGGYPQTPPPTAEPGPYNAYPQTPGTGSPYSTYDYGQQAPHQYGQPQQGYPQAPQQGYQQPAAYTPAAPQYGQPQPQAPYGQPADPYAQQATYGHNAGYPAQYGHNVPMRPPHNFGQAIKAFFRNYVNFQGRANRSEFWYVFLGYYAVYLLLYIPMMVMTAGAQASAAAGEVPNMAGIMVLNVLLMIFAFGLLLPMLSLWFRRMHDAGQSGAFSFVPIANLVFALMPSKPEGARFDDPSGAQPKLGTD